MLTLGNADVRRILDGREKELLSAVRDAYLQHEAGRSALPHSVFLRFPGDDRNRIIALPAHLGGEEPKAGIKWISSFPGNVARGRERASAAIILNSMETGVPEALVEGSTISARRTAASAALAAGSLPPGGGAETGAALVGCGVINYEVLRFLLVVRPEITEITVFDLDAERAAGFRDRCAAELAGDGRTVRVASDIEEALGAHRLVSLATTATVPHQDLAACAPGTLVLHVSLRDVTVPAVLAAVNIVDDLDHVCRAETSVHLAEQATGGRGFVSATLGGLLSAGASLPRDPERVTLFSPFGLGVLDLAVADLVLRAARAEGVGTRVEDFLPPPVTPV
ncbi:2,3-diaminopropionate biosynthesis protein SbnB [Streptomyces bohaiensis]|uniref:2,3-diaminopropionate biosynthesis protein SbnB n=1 Tax=Streptomyces bohaiensis TaxID=1431344 RepID=A0ABX1C7S8_9ACTN|nr:2,3-diaminopropionate biosynthesis protein SbnB [Streptomyces bohaiensis]NJQ13377.1 2,3-diaminopropionate biosynthesis protein SbnB [Streptomyces bohaiensis]